ncbi:MAG: SMP-30/gluconolactonase/LRE family protein [Candidatus Desantisbacteria bacterium]
MKKILWLGLILCLITGSVYAKDLVFSAEFPGEYHKYDFDKPSDVSVNTDGYMFVANTGKKCVQRFNPKGELEKEFYGNDLDMLSKPIGVAADNKGNIFVIDADLKCVLGLNKDGVVFGVWGKGDIGKPCGITIGRNGLVYVTDSDKGCIWEFDGKRLSIRKIGETGTGSGQFLAPLDIVYNPTDFMLYVVDTGNHRIQKIYIEGTFTMISVCLKDESLGTLTGIATNNNQSIYLTAKKEDMNGKYEYIYGFGLDFQKKCGWGGKTGFRAGQFGDIAGLFVNKEGTVYAVDRKNNCIQRFDNKGNFISLLSKNSFETGRFNSPVDMAFDSNGNMFVVDKDNHRIQKFTQDGKFITAWGSKSSMLEKGLFDTPTGIAIDRNNNNRVYITDSYNSRIQRFNNNGVFIDSWGELGSGEGKFKYPQDIAIDSIGNAYIVDTSNNRIQVLDRNGNMITKWAVLNMPLDIEVIETSATSREVFVVCHTEHLIRVFDEKGGQLRTIGKPGLDEDDGQFQYPCGIAKDSLNRLYILDRVNRCLHIMDRLGNQLGIYPWQEGMSQGQIFSPEGIAIDDKNNIYIADTGNHRIQRFMPFDFVPTGGVAGTVTNQGIPVYNAQVKINQQETGVVASTGYTDNTGRYSLNGIPMGTYSVMVFKDGYKTGYAMKAVSIKPNNVSTVEEVVLVPLAPVISNEVDLHNYPNPFDPCDGDRVNIGNTTATTDGTVIFYNLPNKVDSAFMEVYNLAGELIWEWEGKGDDLEPKLGGHHIPWQGRSKDGNIVADGVYFCVLTAGGKVETCKIAVKK